MSDWRKHTPGPVTSVGQRGTPGHCSLAQIFGADGLSICSFDSTKYPSIATERAKFTAIAFNHFEQAVEALRALTEAVEYAVERDRYTVRALESAENARAILAAIEKAGRQ